MCAGNAQRRPGGDKQLGLPASLRIKHREDFRRVFAKGKVASDETLVVHALRRDQAMGKGRSPGLKHLSAADLQGSATLLGVSISKRVGHAPRRNRWKRLIREAFRTRRPELPQGLLVVVRPRKGAIADFHAIDKSLPRLLRRLERRL